MKLEVLHVLDCPNVAVLLDRLRQVIDLPVATRQIDTDEEATARGMSGSPTLLVDGADPFADGVRSGGAVSCRIYRDEDGHMVGAPSVQQLGQALAAAGQVEILSSWRTRSQPLDPVERKVHQAILRSFADTGIAPAPAELRAPTVETGTRVEEVLQRLHDGDAIRLDREGRIAVAYPFSATPTRHRVRIGDHVDVYAMCAIDALGIAPMLGQDTAIASVDVTTDEPVTVVTRGKATSWEPPGAVVFVGATAADAPSVDCCCGYLNFFADTAAARAWAADHREVPGQILSQTEAERLGARLFGRLLSD